MVGAVNMNCIASKAYLFCAGPVQHQQLRSRTVGHQNKPSQPLRHSWISYRPVGPSAGVSMANAMQSR